MIELWPFQREIVARAERIRRPLLVLPTGSGKTVVASELARLAANKFVLFIAHRRELIFQARDKLRSFGIDAGVILAGEPLDRMRRVQVASLQTLWARCYRGDRELPPADLVFIDEAHRATAETYQRVIASYPDARLIGLTATPCRRDGRGLGSAFDALIEGPQIAALIDAGYLVPTKVFAPTTPDLRGVRSRGGDYVKGELAERMDRAELVGDIVSTWIRLGEKRKTVVFAAGVAHAIHLADEFKAAGVRAESIDGKTPKDERDWILERLEIGGDLDVVCNCQVLTEGWDAPHVSCAVLARPTKSTGIYRQMLGRVIRAAPRKADAIVLDHAGATIRHGFIEDPIEWSLDPDTRVANTKHAERQAEPSSRLVECSQCKAIRTAGEACGNCGFMPKRRDEFLHTRAGELARLDRNGKLHPSEYTLEERERFYQGLLYLALARGHKPASASYRFKDKFGAWPSSSWTTPRKPSAEVIAWDRHCRIRFAKAKAREAQANVEA